MENENEIYIAIHGEPKAIAKFFTELARVYAIPKDTDEDTDDGDERELTPKEQADQLTQEVMTLLEKYPAVNEIKVTKGEITNQCNVIFKKDDVTAE